MPNLGYTGSSGWSSYVWFGANVQNWYWGVGNLSMPSPGGVISSASVYAAGANGRGSITGRIFVAYGGTVQAVSTDITFGQGSGATGGQAWHTFTLPTPIFAPAGTAVEVGAWFSNFVAGSGWEFSIYTGGSGNQYDDATSATAPTVSSALPAHTIHSGSAIGAYVTYTPAGIRVRRTSAWSNVPLDLKRGTLGLTSLKIRRGTSWNNPS